MEKKLLEQYIKEGLSTYAISKKIGIGQSSIRYWLNKFNLKTNIIATIIRKHLCKCGETNKENFYGRMLSRCKKCHAKTKSYYNRINKKKLIEYKGGKCTKCGYSKCDGALEFHHLNPKEKDPNFIKLRNHTFERAKKEIDKCILVCANCHREIHTMAL